MPNRRKPRKNAHKNARRLDVAAAGVLPAAVPKRWVKLFVGIFLLAPAAVLTQTFFTAFARTTVRDAFWITEEFWFFSLGAVLMSVAFFSGLRPIWLYVFGHELTHAIWVLACGGKVHRFRVTRQGGHVLADRTNTWIALAPYFFPIYSVFAIAVYGIAGLFVDVGLYRQWLFGAIGFTWAYHFLFSCWMITKGQPDLYYGGTFFSLVVIYLLNLSCLAAMLVFASPGVSVFSFASELASNAIDATVAFTLAVNRLVR